MKMNRIVVKLSAGALCAAAFALAPPAHAQYALQSSVEYSPQDNSEPDMGSGTHKVTFAAGSVTVTASGQSSAQGEAQVLGQGNEVMRQTYMWMGTDPVPTSGTFTAQETDTLSATASASGPASPPPTGKRHPLSQVYSAVSTAGTTNTKAIGANTASTPPVTNNSYGPMAAYQSIDYNGMSAVMNDVTLSASAAGTAEATGSSFASMGQAQASFK